MRDPNRIFEILFRIEKIWEKHPDLRLGQLIGNVIDVKYLYEIDDKKLLELIEKTYDEIP